MGNKTGTKRFSDTDKTTLLKIVEVLPMGYCTEKVHGRSLSSCQKG